MASDPRPLWRALLEGWLAIAGRFGAVQTLLLLTFFYVALIGPASILQAIARRDQLDKGGLRSEGSLWRESESSGADLERAKLSS